MVIQNGKTDKAVLILKLWFFKPDYFVGNKWSAKFTGYNFTDAKTVDPEADPSRSDSAIYRRVPVYVNYAINDNFNIWGEAEFDANSTSEKDHQLPGGETGTMLSAGARYTF